MITIKTMVLDDVDVTDKDDVKNHAILVPWKIDHENLGKWKW